MEIGKLLRTVNFTQ